MIEALVLTVPAAGGPLLQLPTAQAGCRNHPNLSQREVFTDLTGHPEGNIPLRMNINESERQHLTLATAMRCPHHGRGLASDLSQKISPLLYHFCAFNPQNIEYSGLVFIEYL